MPPHKSRSASITCGEGQQNGAGIASPLRFLLHGRAGLCLVLLWSLRGCDNSRSAFYLSRQRHGAGINPKAPAPSRHRCRVRVVRDKKTMPDKTPVTGFFIATHHPECQAWSLRVLFIVPARPSDSQKISYAAKFFASANQQKNPCGA